MIMYNDSSGKKHFNAMNFALVLIVAIGIFFTWILTCGCVKVFTSVFGFQFSWKLGTGIWLVLVAIEIVAAIIDKIRKANHIGVEQE